MSKYRITVEGKTYEMDVELIGANGAVAAPVAKAAAPVAAAPKAAPKAAPAAAPKAAAGAGSIKVEAGAAGKVFKLEKKVGDAVKKGDAVVIIEAMKMENEIQADADGTVTAILVQKGDSVLEGAELLKIA